ncbi:MAG: hypothetical protein COA57_06865 [Flavobacteriales bacterium]|nr:MAG: hypothetical protein COA57_06865 [Flavobacteriales bacterium]
MKSNHRIDRLFNQKLQKREFEFSEENWKAAEQLILADEKNKVSRRRGVLAVFSIAGIAVAIFIFSLFTNTDSSEQLVEKPSNPPIEKAAEKQKTQTLSDENTVVEDTQQPTENKSNSLSNEQTIQNQKSEINRTQEAVDKTFFEDEKLLTTSVKATKPNTDNKQITKTKNKKNETGGKQDNRENTDAFNQTSLVAGNQSQSQVKNKKEIIYDSNAEVYDDEEIATQTISQEKEKHRKVIKMPSLKISLSGVFAKKAKEEELDANSKPLKDRLNWLRKGTAGLVFGPNLSFGMQGTESTEANPVIGGQIGLRYSYRINDLFSMDAGLMYHLRGGLNVQTSAVQQSMETPSKSTIISTKTLYLQYLDIPLYFNYRSNRHNILLGMQYSQLLGAIDEIQTSIEENAQLISESTETKWRKNDSFNAYDLGLMAGYEYVLNEQFNIGIYGNYGLFDVTSDKQLGIFQKDTNRQIRLMLEYKFLNY